jgi:hypothetical protein
MSLILDALKKSDKKRQDVSAPRLDTVHDNRAKRNQRRPTWIYLLTIVLLLNVGLLLWVFVPRKLPTNGEESVVNPQQAVPARQRIAVPESRPIPDPMAKLPEQDLPALPNIKEEGGAIDDTRIYLVSELPTSLRRRIPPLHMSLHAYSKSGGSASMVRINDQMLREGAQLDGKIRLETITKDGAVFRYSGYRFLVPRRAVAEK